MTDNYTYLHEFANKYGFKGACDGISKLIKTTIKRLELKCTIVLNAFDYYHYLFYKILKSSSDPK